MGALIVVLAGGALRRHGVTDTAVDVGMGAALLALVVAAWLIGRRRP